MTKGKLIKLTPCGVVVGGLLLLGWQRWQYSNAYVSTDNAELNGVIIPVRAKLSGGGGERAGDGQRHGAKR